MHWPRRIAAILLILGSTSCQHVDTFTTPTQLIQFNHQGTVREYWVHIPPDLGPGKHPLLVLLHGRDSDGFNMMRTGGFFSQAAKEHYIILAPNAAGGRFQLSRDTDFVAVAIDRMSRSLGYQPSATFLIGYDQGAEFAMDLVNRDLIPADGVGVVGGLSAASVSPDIHSPSLMFIVGEEDPQLFHPDRPAAEKPDALVRRWAKSMSCSTTVRATIEFVRYTTRYGCSNEARFVYIVIGEHGSQWPRAKGSNEFVLSDPSAGPYNRHFDAATVLWKFFSRASSDY